MLKLVGILLAVVAVASAQLNFLEEREQDILKGFFSNFMSPCQNITGASDADIEKLLNYTDIENHTRGSKCALNCIMKMFSLLDYQNGEYGIHMTAFTKIREIAESNEIVDEIRSLIRSCPPKTQDECEVADQTMKCLCKKAETIFGDRRRK